MLTMSAFLIIFIPATIIGAVAILIFKSRP
jgi:hypothetical protein